MGPFKGFYREYPHVNKSCWAITLFPSSVTLRLILYTDLSVLTLSPTTGLPVCCLPCPEICLYLPPPPQQVFQFVDSIVLRSVRTDPLPHNRCFMIRSSSRLPLDLFVLSPSPTTGVSWSGCGLNYPQICSYWPHPPQQVFQFVDSLVPTVRRALCDPLPEVRLAAAKTFDNLHNTIGSKALDDILPDLLHKMVRVNCTVPAI